MLHAVAVTAPVLITEANAVAVVPTCTERETGKTADTIELEVAPEVNPIAVFEYAELPAVL